MKTLYCVHLEGHLRMLNATAVSPGYFTLNVKVNSLEFHRYTFDPAMSFKQDTNTKSLRYDGAQMVIAIRPLN